MNKIRSDLSATVRNHQRTSMSLLISIIISLLLVATSCAGNMSDEKKKDVVYQKYDEYRKGFPSVTEISARKAITLLERKGVVFVDTREPEEIGVSTLPGAVSENAFLNSIGMYRDKVIVAYCTIGKRSGEFAIKMGSRGVDVSNLKGGLLAWLLEGGEVHDQKEQKVMLAHVYGKEWDLAPKGYKTVRF